MKDLAILTHFAYGSIASTPHREAAAELQDTAFRMGDRFKVGAETSAGLRKLLEARDCFLRAEADNPKASAGQIWLTKEAAKPFDWEVECNVLRNMNAELHARLGQERKKLDAATEALGVAQNKLPENSRHMQAKMDYITALEGELRATQKMLEQKVGPAGVTPKAPSAEPITDQVRFNQLRAYCAIAVFAGVLSSGIIRGVHKTEEQWGEDRRRSIEIGEHMAFDLYAAEKR